MTDSTGRIPLWIIGTVVGIFVIGLIGFFLWFIFWIRLIAVVIG